MKLFLPEVPEWWSYRAALAANDDKSYGAYFIGHILWQQYRLRKKSAGLKLPMVKLREAGFGRSYITNALKSLEGAGLIKLKKFRNQSPEIVLVTAEILLHDKAVTDTH